MIGPSTLCLRSLARTWTLQHPTEGCLEVSLARGELRVAKPRGEAASIQFPGPTAGKHPADFFSEATVLLWVDHLLDAGDFQITIPDTDPVVVAQEAQWCRQSIDAHQALADQGHEGAASVVDDLRRNLHVLDRMAGT